MFWGLSQVALDFTIIYLIIFSSEKISLKFLWDKNKKQNNIST